MATLNVGRSLLIAVIAAVVGSIATVAVSSYLESKAAVIAWLEVGPYSPAPLDHVLSQVADSIAPDSAEDVDGFGGRLRNLLEPDGVGRMFLPHPLDRLDSYWVGYVENTGSARAEDIVLRAPETALAVIRREAEPARIIRGSTLNLGSLNPTERVQVEGWAYAGPNGLFRPTRFPSLAHRTGLGTVRVAASDSIDRWVARHPYIMLLISMLLVAGALFGLLAVVSQFDRSRWRADEKRREQERATNDAHPEKQL